NLHNPRTALLTYQSPNVKNLSQNRRIPLDYNPRLLGYLVYHPVKKDVTRLDIVALGDVRGRPNIENVLGERVGKANPLGIAFELVTDPKPADSLPPRGARDETAARPNQNLVEQYLGLPRRGKKLGGAEPGLRAGRGFRKFVGLWSRGNARRIGYQTFPTGW